MNTYEEELRTKWNGINCHDGGSIQLAVEHPLDWFVRYATADHKSIVIVSETPADKITSSKSIEAACNKRKDGKYAVSFTLMNREQEDVFITMSSDIIEFSRYEKRSEEYAAWLKLLDHKRSALMSSNAQKGMIAELLFLKEKIEKGMQPSDAVAGWVGPDGADQDFVYDDAWYEIKTTVASSSQVKISSVEQLDNPDEGELVVFRIDKCAPAKSGAVTLYAMVHLLLGMMSSNVGAVDDFVLKLGSAGYIDMNEYDKEKFSVSAKQTYLVKESFPRIVREVLPVEIVNLEYCLDLPSLDPWTV